MAENSIENECGNQGLVFVLDFTLLDVGTFLLFIVFLFRQQSGGGFGGFILAVFVGFGLGGVGRAPGFSAAGRSREGEKGYKKETQKVLHRSKIGVLGYQNH